jgi:energy-coupling factor transport system ATP-binding protein
MEDMAQYCDRVVVMNDASVYTEGTVNEVFSRAEMLERIGLDVPEIAKIATILRSRGVPLFGNLYTVSGVRDALLALLKGGDAL